MMSNETDNTELFPKEFTERIHMKAKEDPTEENNYNGTITTEIISYEDHKSV